MPAAPSQLPAHPVRGNPNLHLAPRCGAKTRSGCACRAPAMHGKRRCRMHGGGSTGPRTAEGLERLRAARTRHGRYGAQNRATCCRLGIMLRRSRVAIDALLLAEQLPPDLFARLHQEPPELLPDCDVPAMLTETQAHAVRQAEAAALAPWQQAIAAIRARRLAAKAAPEAIVAEPVAEPHAPVRCQLAEASGAAGMPQPADSAARPHTPDPAADPARPHATGQASIGSDGCTSSVVLGEGQPPTASPNPPKPVVGGGPSPSTTRIAPACADAARPHAPDRRWARPAPNPAREAQRAALRWRRRQRGRT